MDVYKAVKTVLAIRSYKPEALPPEVIHKILEAGRLTGSSMNLQPWHFIAVEDREDLEALGKLARTGPYIAEAGLVVAVVIEPSKFAVSDASRAIQSMILTAWEEGIGSNWVGFSNLQDAQKYLNIPEDMDLLAIVPFGYSDEISMKGEKKRKPSGEVVHKGRFGESFNGSDLNTQPVQPG